MLIQVAVRIQFFAFVGLRSPFPFWLKTKLFRTSRCSQKSLAPFLHFQSFKKESEVVQSCPTLYNPMHCSLPGSSVHGIFQARALERVASAFSRPKILHTNLLLIFLLSSSFLSSLPFQLSLLSSQVNPLPSHPSFYLGGKTQS